MTLLLFLRVNQCKIKMQAFKAQIKSAAVILTKYLHKYI